jgi:hypothetical protein
LRYREVVPPEGKPAVPAEQEPARRKASVVITAWNCEEALRRCVASLEASAERSSFEIIVVDKASRDGCGQVDAEFPAVTVLRLPRNFGQTRARNIGIRTAQTDLILLLSPFAELEPEAMAAGMRYFESNPQAAAASVDLGEATDRLFVPAAGELASLCDPARDADFARALWVRKGFLQGMNYFDEKRFSEFWHELELYWQLRNAGKRVEAVPGAAGRLHPAQPGLGLDGAARDLIYSDRAAAATAFLGKHQGLGAGVGFQLKRVLGNLTAPRKALNVLSGSRIDGTQGGVLA